MTADQYDCTEAVVETTPTAAVIANLGTAAYALRAVEDRDKNFYMTGAMGLTTPLGLGVAVGHDAPVTVLDGDGSMLMSLGALATVGRYDPPNLTVVVFDNGRFETTGGQPTLSGNTDFAAVAADCGVASWSATSTDEFRDAYAEAVEHDGSSLVAVEVDPFELEGSPNLDYAHAFLKHRFHQALLDG